MSTPFAKKARERQRKVLVFQESWGRGGIETFVMNLVRELDPLEYDVELFSVFGWDNCYDDELAALGIEHTAVFPGSMPGLAKRFLHGTRAWKRVLSNNDVDVVHVNAMNGVTLAYAAIAKRKGVPLRVVHSHSNDFGQDAHTVKMLFHLLGRMLWGDAATARLACSQSAGIHLFNQKSFGLVRNGIDIERFTFNPDAHKSIREGLGIAPHALVTGCVGRISSAKNSLFSIRVLQELQQFFPDSYLLLVGNGELEEEACALAEHLGVGENYVHVDSVSNPEDYYSAMDVFLLPSLFEGLPYALVEAQCSGLPCVVSEAVQDDAAITDLVHRMPLSAGAHKWAKAVLSRFAAHANRASYAQIVDEAGFSVAASVRAVLKVYDGTSA